MLVKKEELVNLVKLGNKDMILLIADDAENVGAEIQNTSICSQDKTLLDKGIITVNKMEECISLSDKAFVTPDGISIYNIYCYSSFFNNKDIVYLFSDLVSLCMSNGYDVFRCFIQDNEKERIVSFTFGIPALVLGATREELISMSSNMLKAIMEELVPFLEGINNETPETESLETFGYNIIPFKDPSTEEFYIEIDHNNKSVKLLATDLER